ncbi:RICIN domain-containing protein [Streptomyces sp. NPDC059009]|uniref:RICIN domain-containing protein n=1 Tax=Streptomyces sp. NPDC059009 TaxID=3346694 RepID=UPI003694CEFE
MLRILDFGICRAPHQRHVNRGSRPVGAPVTSGRREAPPETPRHGHPGRVGNHTQTWAQDPFAKDTTAHQWFLRLHTDGTVAVETYANHRRLTAGATPADVATLQEHTDSLSQRWRLVRHAEGGNDYYIVSVVHPRYALAIADHLQGNDRLVGLTRMWGGPNLSQLWRIYPTAEDEG